MQELWLDLQENEDEPDNPHFHVLAPIRPIIK